MQRILRHPDKIRGHDASRRTDDVESISGVHNGVPELSDVLRAVHGMLHPDRFGQFPESREALTGRVAPPKQYFAIVFDIEECLRDLVFLSFS